MSRVESGMNTGIDSAIMMFPSVRLHHNVPINGFDLLMVLAVKLPPYHGYMSASKVAREAKLGLLNHK